MLAGDRRHGSLTLTVNPALGLMLGWITELIRAAIVRNLYRSSTDIPEGR